MTVKPPSENEVTPEATWLRRREFLKNAGLFTAGAAAVGGAFWALSSRRRSGGVAQVSSVDGGVAGRTLTVASRQDLAGQEAPTAWPAVTGYNNFYEFGTDKADPEALGGSLRTRPWTVEVTGLVHTPTTFGIDELLTRFPLEERVYRMRCVEAWSMVVPWLGFPLKSLLDVVQPLGSAKYVAFETLVDPEQLPGQRRSVLDWPYVEGLRLDEAMHPLTLLSVGLYGKELLPQNGAPIRLVVPWKYGFKGIKSIVRVHLTETQPPTSWNIAAASEYGFYANVNPAVAHPRWSQASERRIGELLRRPTLPFNGYAEDVAQLYSGMDLTALY